MGKVLYIPSVDFSANALATINYGGVVKSPNITINDRGYCTISSSSADIYYTIDGTTPTSASLKYTDVFRVANGVSVKAIAIAHGASSTVSEKTYNNDDIVFQLLNHEFDGTRDTVVLTEKSLTQSLHDYTFVVELGDYADPYKPNTSFMQRNIYSEMDSASPWYGVVLRVVNTAGTNKYYYDASISNSSLSGNATMNGKDALGKKVVYAVNAATLKHTIYYYVDGVLKSQTLAFEAAKWIPQTNPTPMVGSDQYQDYKYMDGLMKELTIYNRVLTDDEINAFLGA